MPKKLHGMLNLSKIDKSLIQEREDKNGNIQKVLWIDIVPNRNGADEYGNTHSLSIYNKETGQKIYLANLKEVEFGNGAQTAAPVPSAQDDGKDDLPF